MRLWCLGLMVAAAGLCLENWAAEFVPRYLTVELLSRRPHWLARNFGERLRNPATAMDCSQIVAGHALWMTQGHFDRPDRKPLGLFIIPGGGFVSNKTLSEFHFHFTPELFLKSGGTLFTHYSRLPIPSLALVRDDWDTAFSEWKELFAQPALAKGFSGVRTLQVSVDALPALAATRSFPNLHSLNVDPVEATSLVALLNSGNFPKLRRLVLGGAALSAQELSALLAAPGFSSITEIAFQNMNFGDAGLEVVANAPAMAHIEALALIPGSRNLCPNHPTHVGLQRLFESNYLGALRKLVIDSIWELDAAGVDVLSAWPGLAQLEYLELYRSESDVSVARMLSRRRLDKLRELRLEGTDYNDPLLGALAKNLSLANLERMVVDLHPDILPSTVRRVVDAPHLRNSVISYDMKLLQ